MKSFQEYLTEIKSTAKTHHSESDAIAHVNKHKEELTKGGYAEGKHETNSNPSTGGTHVRIPFKHPDGRTATVIHNHDGKGKHVVEAFDGK